MSTPTLVNGVETDQIDACDRGLAYGDGVFETMLVAKGQPVWWEAHLARLQRGCVVLGIEPPPTALLRSEVERLAAGAERAVLKLIVTRGPGARGYAPPRSATAARVLSLHPAPEWPAAGPESGIQVRWCRLQLALQPRLAGIKHLNRLEQVLARGEWQDPAIAEGLMRDAEGRVIGATAANLFVVRGGRLATPALDRCGIAGTAREWVLARGEVQVRDLLPREIEDADELFLSSCLRGILPVARLGGREWSPGPVTRSLQQQLWRELPALQPRAD